MYTAKTNGIIDIT